jgi:ribose transport system permease protein
MNIWSLLKRLYNDYGILVVLIGLCILFSLATWAEQHSRGTAAGKQVARKLMEFHDRKNLCVVIAGKGDEERAFATAAEELLYETRHNLAAVIRGDPPAVRQELQALLERREIPHYILCSSTAARWALLHDLSQIDPVLKDTIVISPTSYWWPNFLKGENLLNITNQITVIAIIAVGMTMVIITGGIDLSVGSLVALSAVMTTLAIREWAGAESASAVAMTAAALGASLTCGLVGLGTGVIVTLFRRPPPLPPFIVTLAVMLATNGAAYLLSQGQSINQVPDSFVWLGRGADVLGIPNAVLLMLLIYVAAHLVMTRTVFGRYLYAVGGNPEAARLSGVPVRSVLMAVYALCGFLAGVGGVVLASQLKSGAPSYGQMYELYVIAAVVVGGTSLSGGQGHIFGTLIGALIIAVIQNGMNLMGLESYTQKIVLGTIILLAVILDRWKRPRSVQL